MEVLPTIPRFDTPSGLPETFEDFEQLKQDQRDALRRYWAAQPESARKKELERIFTKKEHDVPEPWVDMEIF
jgi:hypothetical protein